MSTNKFSPSKFHDFTIVDDNDLIVGRIRIKPSGVLWASKGEKKWRGVSIDEFADFMKNQKRQTK